MAREQGAPDWLLPVLLIGFALITGLAGWGIYEVARDDDPGERSLAGELEVYTDCLSDHGAGVPRVETRPDGGFAVIVPGSLLEHEVDLEQWRAAAEQCRDVQPTLESLFGNVDLGFGGLAPLFGSGLFEGGGRGFGDGGPFGSPDLRELCERLERGAVPGGVDRRELRELCELMGA